MDDAAVVAELEQAWREHVVGDPRAQLEQWRKREADQEHRVSIPTPISQYLMARVCARYGLRVYRPARTRWSTLCVKAPPGFMREVMGPLLEQMTPVVETTARIVDGWWRGDQQAST
jgi:hypothetical protein